MHSYIAANRPLCKDSLSDLMIVCFLPFTFLRFEIAKTIRIKIKIIRKREDVTANAMQHLLLQ